jgi:acetoin utilization deacetylase AcuC-like enzyme
MKNDALGRLNVEPEDIIIRDEIVFELAQKKNVPIIMLLSGGYQMENAKNISDSINNLHRKFRILG